MAKQTFMARVKAYRKLHPRTSQVEAMKKLSGKKVTKRRVTGVKTQKPVARKKSVVRTERVTVIGAARKKSPTHKIDSLYRTGMIIIGRIDKMEAELKKTKNKDVRALLIGLINGEHDKLDMIKKQAKKSA